MKKRVWIWIFIAVLVLAACAPASNPGRAGSPTITACPTLEGSSDGICPVNPAVTEGTNTPAAPGQEVTSEKPTGAMPPLDQGGEAWVRVSAGEVPFSFELPNGWTRRENMLEWYPAGVVPENGPRTFGVRSASMAAGQELEAAILPGGSTVQDRTETQVMGQPGWWYRAEVCEAEGCATKSYLTMVAWKGSDGQAYGLYVQAPTEDERASLEAILERAVRSLA